MKRLSDGRHGVRQTIEPPGVQTQTSISHVPAKDKEARQIQPPPTKGVPGPTEEELEPAGLISL